MLPIINLQPSLLLPTLSPQHCLRRIQTTLFALPSPKEISKKWQHIHRFDLRIELKSFNHEDAAQKKLGNFFSTLLQGDPTAIILPYLKLDRVATGIADLSERNTVASIKGVLNLK
jgi:hypothetical protein